MLPKRCQRRSKGRPKNVLKMMIVFSSILSRFGLPKGGPKSYLTHLLRCLFGPWGPSGSRKRLFGVRDPFLKHFRRFWIDFLRKMLTLSFGKTNVFWSVSVGSSYFQISLTCLFSACNFNIYFLKLLLCRHFDHAHVLHIRSHCHFSVPACRYR